MADRAGKTGFIVCTLHRATPKKERFIVISAITKRLQSDEKGFTLIELLVVVIIIGILAAIAIPTFLSQRQRGWQAELTSTVRNVALEVEAAATAEMGDYTTVDQADVTAFTTTVQGTADDPVEIDLVSTSTTDFVICGEHAQLQDSVGNHNVTYNSDTGGVEDYVEGTACP